MAEIQQTEGIIEVQKRDASAQPEITRTPDEKLNPDGPAPPTSLPPNMIQEEKTKHLSVLPAANVPRVVEEGNPRMVTPLERLTPQEAWIDCPFCQHTAKTRITSEGDSQQTLAKSIWFRLGMRHSLVRNRQPPKRRAGSFIRVLDRDLTNSEFGVWVGEELNRELNRAHTDVSRLGAHKPPSCTSCAQSQDGYVALERLLASRDVQNHVQPQPLDNSWLERVLHLAFDLAIAAISIVPSTGNTSFTLPGSYLALSCPTLGPSKQNHYTNFTNSEALRPGNRNDSFWFSSKSGGQYQMVTSVPLSALDSASMNTKTRDAREFVWESLMDYNTSFRAECDLTTTYVDSNVTCSGTSSGSVCSVPSVRRSVTTAIDGNWTVFDIFFSEDAQSILQLITGLHGCI
ncbi:hypothetical protein FHL15_006262 [Xylaria flabelliformis]|uniref:LITAF domain-containing protein n=1 Tax=Xylaria flabelliformis TaxID=2512241 RepID=A0A553HY26_9PEZI|nr:hypothetical protein FHL15_006262 [Xylaria flabelliformis]